MILHNLMLYWGKIITTNSFFTITKYRVHFVFLVMVCRDALNQDYQNDRISVDPLRKVPTSCTGLL